MDSNFDFLDYPARESHTHTVVFLHGRGDNARNFATSLAWSPDSQGRVLPEIFPSFRWVFPTAKMIKRAAWPQDVWSQWFDVWNTNNFQDHEELQAEGLRNSVAGIRKILANEAEILGGQWNRIILAGISQGAATSVHTLFNLNLSSIKPQIEGGIQDRPRGLGAFLGFSCRLPFPGRSLVETRKVLNLEDVPEHDDVLRNTPILLEHCIDDPLIPIEYGRNLRSSLTELGAHVTWKEYPDGGHWFNAPAGIDDVVEFLNRTVLMSTSIDEDGDAS
jgi:predicted esterase